jgi:hypothetical protein
VPRETIKSFGREIPNSWNIRRSLVSVGRCALPGVSHPSSCLRSIPTRIAERDTDKGSQGRGACYLLKLRGPRGTCSGSAGAWVALKAAALPNYEMNPMGAGRPGAANIISIRNARALVREAMDRGPRDAIEKTADGRFYTTRTMSMSALRLLARSSGNRSIGDRSCRPNVREAPTDQRPRQLTRNFGSREHFEYRPRFPNEPAQSPNLRQGFAGILPMLERILVTSGSARARRAAMHPTPCFSPHGRGHARFAGTRFGPTAPARQHWACVTRMIAGHFFAGAGQEPALAPSGR